MAYEEAAAPATQFAPDQILKAIERQREANAVSPAEQERVPYLGFLLDSEVYGLPLEQLREVARLTRLRRVPGAPSGVAGLVNLRGEIICALDVRTILGLPARGAADPAIFVALRGFDDPLGLVVDSIADIYSIDPGQIESPPATWPAERAACFVGTVRVPEGLMGLLDLNRLVKI
jgi:purine-binding chemotaxis protein CheW